MSVAHTVQVRWWDLDPLGHVGHAAYLTYFEEQRDQWLSGRLGLGGSDYVVASILVDYQYPIEFEDGPVEVEGSLQRIGRTSLDLEAEIRSAPGRVCARSRATIVLWDATSSCARPITDGERASLAPDLVTLTTPKRHAQPDRSR